MKILHKFDKRLNSKSHEVNILKNYCKIYFNLDLLGIVH